MRGELQSLKHNEVKPGRLRMSKPSNAPFQPRCCVEGPVHVLARPTNLCCCLWCQQPGYFANCGVQPNYKHCHAPKQLKVPISCCTMLYAAGVHVCGRQLFSNPHPASSLHSRTAMRCRFGQQPAGQTACPPSRSRMLR